MKFHYRPGLLFISLIFLSSCESSECVGPQVEYNRSFSASLETVNRAAQDSNYRAGNFSSEMDSNIDKMSSLASKLCDSNESERAKQEIVCLKGLKVALSSNDEKLMNEYSKCLSNMNPWHAKIVNQIH